MFGFGPIDCALVALYALRRIGLRRTVLAALGIAAVAWVTVPRPCSCIRLPLQRCIYVPRLSPVVRADARNLMSLQEIHFADNGSYTEDLEALGFSASHGVEVYTESSGEGWGAWVTHRDLDTGEGCMVDVDLTASERREAAPAGPRMECRF